MLHTTPAHAGSPPHAWGHYTHARRHCCRRRFTPTRVGTLQEEREQFRIKKVHPHTRGDIVLVEGVNQAPAGSPPHAWGH